jgi:hypothetical protein
VRAESDDDDDPSTEPVRLTAEHMDSRGTKCRTEVEPKARPDTYVPQRRTTRIVEFPSKRLIMGDL